MPSDTTLAVEDSPLPRKKAFYTGLSFQVLAGVAIAVVLGYVKSRHGRFHEAPGRRGLSA